MPHSTTNEPQEGSPRNATARSEAAGAFVKRAVESLKRYGGKPEALLRDYPDLDLRKRPSSVSNTPSGS
jgi:hypothetical protein